MNGSPQNDLNKADIARWKRNLIVFSWPIWVIYSTQVLGALQYGGFEYTWSHLGWVLVPTAVTVGAILKYVFDGITDLYQKYVQDNTKREY